MMNEMSLQQLKQDNAVLQTENTLLEQKCQSLHKQLNDANLENWNLNKQKADLEKELAKWKAIAIQQK